MKNIAGILFILFLQIPLSAQSKKEVASPKDTAVFDEVLETAYLLTAIGKYEDAHAYFVYALREVSNKQICNNAGVAAILAARNYFRPNEPEVKFHYPVELDLKTVSARGGNDFKEIRTRLLREAIGHFDNAIRLDTGYAPAYLNRACAQALLGETEPARAGAKQAAVFTRYDKTVVDAHVLTGILYAGQGDVEKAKEFFSAAAKQGSALAAYNLKILLNEDIPASAGTFSLPGGIETIDNISLNDPFNIPEPDPKSEIVLNAQIRLYHNLHPGPHSRFYFSDNTATGQQTYFLLTGPGYQGRTLKKLGTGAGQAEIETAYGAPVRAIETVKGQILVYSSVILVMDASGKLARWVLWGETE